MMMFRSLGENKGIVENVKLHNARCFEFCLFERERKKREKTESEFTYCEKYDQRQNIVMGFRVHILVWAIEHHACIN